MVSLDQKVYYICCTLLVLLCIVAYQSGQTAGGFADLAALVLIIMIALTLGVSFILSHLILKRWYTLSLPVSFVIVQVLLSAYVRAQALKRIRNLNTKR